MSGLVEKIAQADEAEIGMLLQAVLQRYAVLFPDWELSIFSLQKSADRDAQLDQMIAVLQKIKNA